MELGTEWPKQNSDFYKDKIGRVMEKQFLAQQTAAGNNSEKQDFSAVVADILAKAEGNSTESREHVTGIGASATVTGILSKAQQISPERNMDMKNSDIAARILAEARQKLASEKEEFNAREFLKQKIDELYEKFRKGETKPSYQIGAVSFTEQEWDKLLEKFDALQEAIRAQMQEEQEKRAQAQEREEQRLDVQDAKLLAGEFTSCVYPSGNPEKEDTRYITCYTEEGIVCRNADGKQMWSINFENKEQYDKVMQLVGQFPQEWNMRFASRKNFWEDFLNDDIDMDGFLKFLSETDNGVPDYTIKDGDSLFIDQEKAVWAKYMNEGNAKFYTAEEMWRMQEDLLAKNAATLPKLGAAFGEM